MAKTRATKKAKKDIDEIQLENDQGPDHRRRKFLVAVGMVIILTSYIHMWRCYTLCTCLFLVTNTQVLVDSISDVFSWAA